MSKKQNYDVTYVTVDSISEGVGSSQILPLIQRLSRAGLSINLISFEKIGPSIQIQEAIAATGAEWSMKEFKSHGALGGLTRLLEIERAIHDTRIIHARSDIPAAAASMYRKAPILWDVRSLWADQKAFTESNPLKKRLLRTYNILEDISSFTATAMSTLTHAVVPVLEERHRRIPKLRIVVPTAVDLQKFNFAERLPTSIRGLYSGTYNNYYDLALSRRFVEELQRMSAIEVHWARPKESPRSSLEAGETSTFVATQNEMAGILKDYSFGLSICRMDAGPTLKAAMPTKVAEFLACGRPMVVNAGLGDFDEYLTEFNAGVILNGQEGDTKVKANQLLQLLADPETPSRCRALAEKYFDMDKGAEKYIALYGKM